jgi:hypothetical protein
MAYTNAEARQDLLDTLARIVDEIGVALATLGETYEQLDEYAGDRLEERLFRPVQAAYGRAQRTHAEFAGRYGLPTRSFPPQAPDVAPNDPRGGIEHASTAVGRADEDLAALQDSMLPVEVGDRELRTELAEVRELLTGLPNRADELLRSLGR